MKCQTTVHGNPCHREATHHVSGRGVKPHFCCEACARSWTGWASKDNPVLVEKVDASPAPEAKESAQ